MNTTSPNNRALAEAEKKLTMLLMEIKGSPTFDRVKLYVAKMTGGKLLSAYLHDDGIPPKERAMLAETLTDILLSREYDRLPVLPVMENGNVAPKTAHLYPSIELPKGAVDAEEVDPPVDPDAHLRAMIRKEMGALFETLARVLRE